MSIITENIIRSYCGLMYEYKSAGDDGMYKVLKVIIKDMKTIARELKHGL